MEKKTKSLLIRNIPEDKLKNLETIILPVLKGLDIDSKTEIAPVGMEQLIEHYDTLHGEMRRIGNLLAALKAKGIAIETENIEKILKLNIQHFIGATNKRFNDLEKKMSEYADLGKELLFPMKEKPTVTEEMIKVKLRLGKYPTLRKILTIFAREPDRFFNSAEIANQAYGVISRRNRANVTRLLKEHKKFVEIKKEKGRVRYRLKKSVINKLGL
ncbi:MAG: hypothetical protein ACE5KD_00910 [Candidatus Bathyarchaeia archaeon]